MSARTSVVWTPEFLTYQLSDDHPLNPVRLELMMELSRGLGVLDGVDPVVEQPVTGLPQQEPADDADDQERQHEGAGHHPCLDGAAPEGERGHPSAAQAVPAL